MYASQVFIKCCLNMVMMQQLIKYALICMHIWHKGLKSGSKLLYNLFDILESKVLRGIVGISLLLHNSENAFNCEKIVIKWNLYLLWPLISKNKTFLKACHNPVLSNIVQCFWNKTLYKGVYRIVVTFTYFQDIYFE